MGSYFPYSPVNSRETLDTACRIFRRHNHFLYQDQVYPHARKVWETVCEVAVEMGRKPVEVALAWVLFRDYIFTAIVGSRKPEQVQEFVKSTELKLHPDQLQRLTMASDQLPKVKKGHMLIDR